VRISLFDRKADASPRQVERTWPEICRKIPRPPIRDEKDGPLWSPATFDPPHRLLKNVVELSYLVLDYDEFADFERDLRPWRNRGCALAAHTTFSHSENLHRFRVIIPLADPIPAADFPRLWNWASQLSGGKIDAAASDASRMFYVPGRRSEDAPYLFEICEGDFLDWQALDLPAIDVAPPMTAKVASSEAPSRDVHSLLRKAFAAKDGDLVFRLYQGDTIDYGGDDSRADQALCSKLAFWSGGDPQTLDQMFRGSRLFRDKWDQRHGGDGRTYGQMTIDKALQGRSEFYTNGNRAAPAKIECSRFAFTPVDDLLAEPKQKVEYVWDRTLVAGGTSALCAKPKVGKTTCGQGLAVSVSRGEPFLDRSTRQGKVIHLVLEEKRDEVAERYRRMGAQGSDILIHTGPTPKDAIAALEAAIEEHSPALVIIDPLSRFVRISDFNSYAEVTRSLEPLVDVARSSRCQTHILMVHHNGKGGDMREAGDAVMGSTGFFGAVDTLLTMRKREKARTIESTQRYGEDLPETIIHLDPETGVVSACGDMKEFTLSERKKAVLGVLGDEPIAEAEIKDRIAGSNKGLTSTALRALFDEGTVLRTGGGRKGDPYLYRLQSAAQATTDGNSAQKV
jgi:hypothetical protein